VWKKNSGEGGSLPFQSLRGTVGKKTSGTRESTTVQRIMNCGVEPSGKKRVRIRMDAIELSPSAREKVKKKGELFERRKRLMLRCHKKKKNYIRVFSGGFSSITFTEGVPFPS